MQGVLRRLILIICLLTSLTCITFESLVSNNATTGQLGEDLEIQFSEGSEHTWILIREIGIAFKLIALHVPQHYRLMMSS